MIESVSRLEKREIQALRKKGIAPSVSLPRHFVALARQVNVWRLRHDPGTSSGVRLGVTSLTVGEGRSAVSFNLAASLAALTRSRVLLVESDFGKHYITRRLGHAQSPGLSELVAGSESPTEVIHPTSVAGLSVMGSGQQTDQEALERPFETFSDRLEPLRDPFGSLVFDLPVANHFTAFHSIATHLDGVLLTVESKQIEPRSVERFRRQLDVEGIPIVGLVINKS